MLTMKRKKLPWYAVGGFGLSLLNTIATIYLADALITTGFLSNIDNWTFFGKTVIEVGVFTALKLVAQIVDGVIDIPFAALTDNLKTRWGKRRPVMLLGTILTIGFFIALCFPISHAENSIANSIYIGIMFMLFYSAYTLTYVTYYGTYSEVTENTNDRLFLSNFKSFVDTIQYAIAYALIPVFVGFANIRWISLACVPLGLTMLISIFIAKERSTLPADVAKFKAEHPDYVESKIADETPIGQSIKLTFQNKNFVMWLVVLGVFFFGLQMFLSGQNVLASGPMGMNSWQIAIINSSAFAPVPLMLWWFKKIMKKIGFRYSFMIALGSFALAMITFSISYVGWIPNQYVRLAIGATAGTIGSFGIGAFFMAPYMIPAQAAAEDRIKNKVSNSSMYFAVQGLVTALFGALSSGLLWPNLRNNFGTTSQVSTVDQLVAHGFLEGTEGNYVAVPYERIAENERGLYLAYINGAHIMPYIVAGCCVLAIGLCFLLPKSYDKLGTAKQLEDEKANKEKIAE